MATSSVSHQTLRSLCLPIQELLLLYTVFLSANSRKHRPPPKEHTCLARQSGAIHASQSTDLSSAKLSLAKAWSRLCFAPQPLGMLKRAAMLVHSTTQHSWHKCITIRPSFFLSHTRYTPTNTVSVYGFKIRIRIKLYNVSKLKSPPPPRLPLLFLYIHMQSTQTDVPSSILCA